MVGILMTALKNEQWSGVYNATAPSPVRMGQLCSELGAAMGRRVEKEGDTAACLMQG